MALLEQLIIQGIDVMPFNPPGAALRVTPERATTEHILLDGTRVIQQAEKLSGWTIEVDPGERLIVPLSIKQAVEAAEAAGQPITIQETLSDPSTLRSWTGLVTSRFTEVPGTHREYFNYQFVLRTQEAP